MSDRPDTGAMKFGEDWTGLFVRGKDAFFYRENLRALIEWARANGYEHGIGLAVLDGLVGDLASSIEGASDAQRCRSWPECLAPPRPVP